MDDIDLGDGFGPMSVEDIRKGLMLERDYRKKTESLARDRESFQKDTEELQNKAAAVDLINQYGIGEYVAEMINQAATAEQQGGYPQGNPQQYGQPQHDPNVSHLVNELNLMKQQMEEIDKRYYGDRVQNDVTQFRSQHPDINDETFENIGRFMIDRGLTNLDDAYKLHNYDEHMKAARLDGEKRVKEQLGTGEGIKPPSPVLSGGVGELLPQQGKPVVGNQPGDLSSGWKSALDAAKAEFLSKEDQS